MTFRVEPLEDRHDLDGFDCALETIVTAARAAGGKLVVVDAVDDDAARFYQHHDFQALAFDPHRLVQKISTIAAALDLPWSVAPG